ncbi:hypothetical protein ACHAPT_002211 [Fusarium lateritium]
MSSTTPTYIQSPHWNIPADSDKVVLGGLIKDPKDPEDMILSSNANPVPPTTIYSGEKTDWRATLDQVHSRRIGLWAKCMQVIEGGLSFSQLESSLENHKFTTLETKYFLPDENYFAQVLKDKDVKNAFACLRQKPVHLITGIKIARGASVSTESKAERAAQAELKVDATGGGGSAIVGPEASLDSQRKIGISYGGSTDYIFAYQVMRIKPKKRGTESQKYVKGAMFGKGEQGGAAEVKVRDDFDIEEETNLGFTDTLEQVDEDQV